MSFSETDCRHCRCDFPSLTRSVNGFPLAYLDGPAGTQVPYQVIEAIVHYYRTCNANSHGEFITSLETDQGLEECREAVAQFLGAQSGKQISFGANMTSLNIPLSRAIGRKLQAGDHVVITQLDHEANRGPWLKLREQGIAVDEVEINKETGDLDKHDFEKKATKHTKVIAIGYASNALGTINDISFAHTLARSCGAFLVVDAVHYAPHFPIDVARIDPDFLLCSAYKFYGPHIGILYSKPGLLEQLQTDAIRTQIQHPPYTMETGTLNCAALMGVKAAVEYIASWGGGDALRGNIVDAMSRIAEYEHGLGRYYYENVKKIPGVTVWGQDFTDKHRAPTVSITVKGIHAAEVAKKLSHKGLLVWNGHFYAIKLVETFGIMEQGGLIRTGISMYTLKSEIDRLLNALSDIALK